MTVVVFRHIESDWVDNIDCVDGFCRKALLRLQQPPSTGASTLEAVRVGLKVSLVAVWDGAAPHPLVLQLDGDLPPLDLLPLQLLDSVDRLLLGGQVYESPLGSVHGGSNLDRLDSAVWFEVCLDVVLRVGRGQFSDKHCTIPSLAELAEVTVSSTAVTGQEFLISFFRGSISAPTRLVTGPIHFLL